MRSIVFVGVALTALLGVAGAMVNCRHPLSSCLPNPEPDLDWNDHLGPVESIRVEDAEMFYADKPLLRQTSKFNRQGQRIETVLYRDDGILERRRNDYEFDERGNWIKQVSSKWVTENGKEFFKPEHVTGRKFTYY